MKRRCTTLPFHIVRSLVKRNGIVLNNFGHLLYILLFAVLPFSVFPFFLCRSPYSSLPFQRNGLMVNAIGNIVLRATVYSLQDHKNMHMQQLQVNKKFMKFEV